MFEIGLQRFLDLFEKRGLQATFFCVGRDLEVEASGSRVVLRGRRTATAPGRGPIRFHCMECGRGDFQRIIELVGSLDTHAARARLAHGLLRVEIPKISDRRLAPRRIEVESTEK